MTGAEPRGRPRFGHGEKTIAEIPQFRTAGAS
jgi:hypothetical protein